MTEGKRLMYRVWCEWDIGQDNLLFKTEEAVLKWVRENENIKEFIEGGSVEDLLDEGLICFQKLEVVE